MPVSALVMQPGGRKSLVLALCVVRRAGPLIIAGSHPEFGRTVFGEIVCESLPVQSDLKAFPAHHMSVMSNRPEMRDGFV